VAWRELGRGYECTLRDRSDHASGTFALASYLSESEARAAGEEEHGLLSLGTEQTAS
jgi:hypothetical protein